MEMQASHGAAPAGGEFGSPQQRMFVAGLQDHLMLASTDLERLHGLLNDASEQLMTHFSSASTHLGRFTGEAGSMLAEAPGLSELRHHLAGAVTALQFQDMASQLILHTRKRIGVVADALVVEATDGDELEAVPVPTELRDNPVTQSEMDAGSIELF